MTKLSITRFSATLALALCVTQVACTGELTYDRDGGGGGTADAMPIGMAGMDFINNIVPIFSIARPKNACDDAVCHAVTNPVLAGVGADIRNNILGNANLIDRVNTANSRIVARGDHTGDALCTGVDTPYVGCTQDEVTLLINWLDAEFAEGN